MDNRFIPKIFTDQGLTGSDFRNDACVGFLLNEFSFGSSPTPEVISLAHSEWNARNFFSITSWANWFDRLSDREFVQFMLERLEGKTLVDLGGGTAVMASFAFLFRADCYINVDMGYLTKDSYRLLKYEEAREFMPHRWKNFEAKREHIDLDPQHVCTKVGLKMDMVDFLSRLQNNSLPVVTLNGIDDCIIHTAEYAIELNRQIRRTLQDGGILFGNKSWIIDMARIGECECLQPVKIGSRHGEDFILEKQAL